MASLVPSVSENGDDQTPILMGKEGEVEMTKRNTLTGLIVKRGDMYE